MGLEGIVKAVTDPGSLVSAAVKSFLPPNLQFLGGIAGAITDAEMGNPMGAIQNGMDSLHDLQQNNASSALPAGPSASSAHPVWKTEPSPPTFQAAAPPAAAPSGPLPTATGTTSPRLTGALPATPTASPWRSTTSPPVSPATAWQTPTGVPAWNAAASPTAAWRGTPPPTPSPAAPKPVATAPTASSAPATATTTAAAEPAKTTPAASPATSAAPAAAATPPSPVAAATAALSKLPAVALLQQFLPGSAPTDPSKMNKDQFMALGNDAFMQAVRDGKIPKEIADSPAAMQGLQARMSSITEMNQLMTSMLQALHQMQMSIIQNVRV